MQEAREEADLQLQLADQAQTPFDLGRQKCGIYRPEKNQQGRIRKAVALIEPPTGRIVADAPLPDP